MTQKEKALDIRACLERLTGAGPRGPTPTTARPHQAGGADKEEGTSLLAALKRFQQFPDYIQLYNAIERFVRWRAPGRLLDREDVEDIVQDHAVEAWNRNSHGAPPEAIFDFLQRSISSTRTATLRRMHRLVFEGDRRLPLESLAAAGGSFENRWGVDLERLVPELRELLGLGVGERSRKAALTERRRAVLSECLLYHLEEMLAAGCDGAAAFAEGELDLLVEFYFDLLRALESSTNHGLRIMTEKDRETTRKALWHASTKARDELGKKFTKQIEEAQKKNDTETVERLKELTERLYGGKVD